LIGPIWTFGRLTSLKRKNHLLEKVEENNIKDILSGKMMKPDYMVKEYFSIILVLENIHDIVHVP
jgi:hypothetical protein